MHLQFMQSVYCRINFAKIGNGTTCFMLSFRVSLSHNQNVQTYKNIDYISTMKKSYHKFREKRKVTKKHLH